VLEKPAERRFPCRFEAEIPDALSVLSEPRRILPGLNDRLSFLVH